MKSRRSGILLCIINIIYSNVRFIHLYILSLAVAMCEIFMMISRSGKIIRTILFSLYIASIQTTSIAYEV